MRNECDTFNRVYCIEFKLTAIVMIAETISLGILSLPSAMATLGLVP